MTITNKFKLHYIVVGIILLFIMYSSDQLNVSQNVSSIEASLSDIEVLRNDLVRKFGYFSK